MADLESLSGNFLFERQKLSESVKKLEKIIMSPKISKHLDYQTQLQIQKEIDRLNTGIFQLDTLAKDLSKRVISEKYTVCGDFLNDLVSFSKSCTMTLQKNIAIHPSGHDVKFDKDAMNSIKSVLKEMIQTFIEFSIESEKERKLRGKKEQAFMQIGFKREDEGIQLIIIADGNGIIPPLDEEHGASLAKHNIRAAFQGKMGRWSSWILHIPHFYSVISGYEITVENRLFYIPGYFVTNTNVSAEDIKEENKYSINSDLELIPIKNSDCDSCAIIEVSVGTRNIYILVSKISEKKDVYIKQMSNSIVGKGRYLGVVVETLEEVQVLRPVLNPYSVVYGVENEK